MLLLLTNTQGWLITLLLCAATALFAWLMYRYGKRSAQREKEKSDLRHWIKEGPSTATKVRIARPRRSLAERLRRREKAPIEHSAYDKTLEPYEKSDYR